MSLDTGHDFRTARMLMKHYLQNHGTVPPLLENMKKYFCSNCPNVYTTKESFKSHVKHMHSNKPKKYERSKIRFQCPYCEKTYCGSKPLQDHIVLKHEKSPKFQCEICQGRYPSEVIFREHMKRVHAKGQIISKCLFGVFNFFQKTNEWIRLYYYVTCFRSSFGRNWRHQKDILKLSDLYVFHGYCFQIPY